MNTRNHGVAFGFLPGNHVGRDDPDRRSRWSVLLVYFALHADARADLAADRHARSAARSATSSTALRHGSVTDFIKLPLGWPPFNLADASITLGVLILFLLIDRARKPTS